MEASLCLEAAERPQWPRVYSLDRLRSRSRMPSLVGDRMRSLPFVLQCRRKGISTVAVCGTEL